MNLSILFVILAQHLHTPPPRPLYVEPITIAPRAVTENEATRIQAAEPVVVPAPVLAPVAETWYDALPVWWPLIALIACWLAYRVYKGRHIGLNIPDRTTLVAVSAPLDDKPPVPLARRSLEDCRTLYIDTVRAQVRAMIGRTDIRTAHVPSAPVEMAWRAWMQAADYQSAKPHHRAVGRSEGAALKGLLATHRQFGGDWIGFAVDRERAVLTPAQASTIVSLGSTTAADTAAIPPLA